MAEETGVTRSPKQEAEDNEDGEESDILCLIYEPQTVFGFLALFGFTVVTSPICWPSLLLVVLGLTEEIGPVCGLSVLGCFLV